MNLLSSAAGKVVVLSSLVAVGVTVYLFRDGERGATVATILSFTCSAVATVFAAYAAYAPQQQARATAFSLSRRARRCTAAVLALGLLVPASTWAWNRWYSDLEVRIPAPVEVREDRPSLVAPVIGTRWSGGELVFTPMLAPVDDLSDCVLPAVLRVEPKLDGQSGRVVAARHGEQVSVAIPDGTHGVQLGLRLEAPGEQNCVVQVAFRRSELHR